MTVLFEDAWFGSSLSFVVPLSWDGVAIVVSEYLVS